MSLALIAQLATAFVQSAPRLGASKLALSSKAAVSTMSLVEPAAAPFELASSMTTAMGLEGARESLRPRARQRAPIIESGVARGVHVPDKIGGRGRIYRARAHACARLDLRAETVRPGRADALARGASQPAASDPRARPTPRPLGARCA